MRALLIAMVGLVVAVPGMAQAEVTIDWVTVGDPGNAADDTGYGSVAYTYQIGMYEVTNAQYAEFLNAVAADDIYSLYSPAMGSGFGGIARGGSPGSYTYSTIAGREEMPVNWVSFYDTLRFANWLHNGQGSASTETGAYTLLGGSSTPSNGLTVTRNAGATVFVASEDEWYKAAYYAGSGAYFDYPAGSGVQPTCAVPGTTPNTANCNLVEGDLTDVGGYTSSASPNGSFDQGGNVFEWNEAIIGSNRGLRGGDYYYDATHHAASARNQYAPASQSDNVGFRVTSPGLPDGPPPLLWNVTQSPVSGPPYPTSAVEIDVRASIPPNDQMPVEVAALSLVEAQMSMPPDDILPFELVASDNGGGGSGGDQVGIGASWMPEPEDEYPSAASFELELALQPAGGLSPRLSIPPDDQFPSPETFSVSFTVEYEDTTGRVVGSAQHHLQFQIGAGQELEFTEVSATGTGAASVGISFGTDRMGIEPSPWTPIFTIALSGEFTQAPSLPALSAPALWLLVGSILASVVVWVRHRG